MCPFQVTMSRLIKGGYELGQGNPCEVCVLFEINLADIEYNTLNDCVHVCVLLSVLQLVICLLFLDKHLH